MKSLILIAAALAIVSCQVSNLNVGSECSTLSCAKNSWSLDGYNYNYTCPKSGQLGAKIINQNGKFFFNFTSYSPLSTSQSVSMPLYQNIDSSVNGLQYYSLLNDGTYFAILNCTIPAAKNYTSLCGKHDLVGGKIQNNSTFSTNCAFGLDRPRFAFLAKEMTLEYDLEM